MKDPTPKKESSSLRKNSFVTRQITKFRKNREVSVDLRKKKKEEGIKKRTQFKNELFAIPNLLTYIRILMIPVILVTLDKEDRYSSYLAALLFGASSMTDFFDGFLARKLNQITTLGKLLDPLADKLIVSAALIVMIPMSRVPSWLVILLLAREFGITGLRGIAASEGMVISASWLGKYKTIFQMISIFCLLVHYPYPVHYFGYFTFYISFQQIGMALLYIALFFSLLSALEYFWKFAQEINSKNESIPT